MLQIRPGTEIAESELDISTSRSSGPGGQNVNKLETRVTVRLDVANSPSLTAEQKERIAARLSSRMSKDGVLRVTSQRHRTQAANRAAAIERLVELLAEALTETPRRHRTRTPRSAHQRRLENKRRQAQRKNSRRPPSHDD